MSHSCEWTRARLARFLDRALPTDDHAAVGAHLDACADCRVALEALCEVDRLVRDAAAPLTDRAATKEEARSFAALQAAMRSRYDLDAAAQTREREMAAEQAGGPARAMTPEEIAGAPLDRAVLRDTRAPAGAKPRRAPSPIWRWLTVGVPVAAAAVVAVVLLVREPRMHEVALERALSTATHETPSPGIAPPAAKKVDADQEKGATTKEEAHEAVREQPAAEAPAIPAAAPAPASASAPAPPVDLRDASDAALTMAAVAPAPAEGEPWAQLREFVESGEAKDENASVEDVGQDRTALLLAAEDRLLALTTASPAPAETEKRPSSPSGGGGTLGTLPHLRGGRSEVTGFRTRGADRSNAPAEAQPAVARPSAHLWLALADGWYLLYQGSREPVGRLSSEGAAATGSDSGQTAAGAPLGIEAAGHRMDPPLLAARALAAYEQAAWVADSLSAGEQARVRQRIAELKTRSRR